MCHTAHTPEFKDRKAVLTNNRTRYRAQQLSLKDKVIAMSMEIMVLVMGALRTALLMMSRHMGDMESPKKDGMTRKVTSPQSDQGIYSDQGASQQAHYYRQQWIQGDTMRRKKEEKKKEEEGNEGRSKVGESGGGYFLLMGNGSRSTRVRESHVDKMGSGSALTFCLFFMHAVAGCDT